MAGGGKFMIHYICTGECGAVSEKPGTCHAEHCSKKGKSFAQCGCSDGKHGRSDKGTTAFSK